MKIEIEREIETAVKLPVKGRLNKVTDKTFRLINKIMMMSKSLNRQSNSLNIKTTGAAILIVDDDFNLRQALVDILSLTAVVYTAANGQEGLEILHQHLLLYPVPNFGYFQTRKKWTTLLLVKAQSCRTPR
jgi:PleD family two-component response regulator